MACFHYSAENHRGDDQPDGVQHPGHPFRSEQGIDCRIARVHRDGTVHCFGDDPVGSAGREFRVAAQLGDDRRLANQREDPAQDSADEEHRYGRHFPDDHYDYDDRHDEQQRRNVVVCGDGLLNRFDRCSRGGDVAAQREDHKNDQCDEHRGTRGEHHVADVREEAYFGGRCGQVRRVAQR